MKALPHGAWSGGAHPATPRARGLSTETNMADAVGHGARFPSLPQLSLASPAGASVKPTLGVPAIGAEAMHCDLIYRQPWESLPPSHPAFARARGAYALRVEQRRRPSHTHPRAVSSRRYFQVRSCGTDTIYIYALHERRRSKMPIMAHGSHLNHCCSQIT